jgi:hypothetical protein
LEELDDFSLEGTRGIYRPVGRVSFEQTSTLVRAAIARARSSRLEELLVDTTALIGFPPPETVDRYFAVRDWASEAGGRLRLAIVARAEMIDPWKFGVTVAANRGLAGNIFTTEAEARAWLDAGTDGQ